MWPPNSYVDGQGSLRVAKTGVIMNDALAMGGSNITDLADPTSIQDHSLLTGEFPLIFKTAIVKPLLKKASLDFEDMKNYRPISNLSLMPKVLEKVVLSQILQNINCNKLLSDFESAYHLHHSTEIALSKVTNDLLSAMDDGKISVHVLLDLSAAFDTIDHEILLHRLHNVFGFGNTVLSWFQSYLENRTQTVVVHGKHSTLASLRYGVPQGSVLGPILFILYTPATIKCHRTLSSLSSNACR